MTLDQEIHGARERNCQNEAKQTPHRRRGFNVPIDGRERLQVDEIECIRDQAKKAHRPTLEPPKKWPLMLSDGAEKDWKERHAL